MNDVKSFIKTFLEDVLVDFPNAVFKYARNEYTDDHMIEVYPNELYNQDKNFIKIQTKLINEVFKQFQEIVFFVSEDSLNRVEMPEFEIKNNILSIKYSELINTICDLEYEDDLEFEMDSCFDTVSYELENYSLAA